MNEENKETIPVENQLPSVSGCSFYSGVYQPYDPFEFTKPLIPAELNPEEKIEPILFKRNFTSRGIIWFDRKYQTGIFKCVYKYYCYMEMEGLPVVFEISEETYYTKPKKLTLTLYSSDLNHWYLEEYKHTLILIKQFKFNWST